MKQNKPLDLIWIIPELIGEIFIFMFTPIFLISHLGNYEVLSDGWLINISISMLLIMNLELKGSHELVNIQWKRKK